MDNIFTDEEYQIWRLIAQAMNAMLKARQRELARYNVSPRQAGVLQISEATSGQVTPYQIAKWVVREHHTILELLKRMERDGLVKRVGRGDRKGSTRITLTEKGIKTQRETMKFESLHRVFAVLSKEERQQLFSILRKLRDEALGQIGASQKFPFPPF